MRRLSIAVALLVLLSGCNVFGAGSGESYETLTPVEVPSATSVRTPTPTPVGECLAPRPATPVDRTAATPADPVPLPLPRTEGVVDGSALVDRHARALSNVSFHLRTNGGTEVWAIADAAAFTYEGVGLGVRTAWAYAVGGTLYTVGTANGRLLVRETPYDVGSSIHERFRAQLTGQRWLTERLGWYNFTVAGTRTWNGTEVRVLRDAVDRPLLVGADAPASGLVRLNVTVYVDRRGIVRHVRHVRHVEFAPESGLDDRTHVSTLTVDGIGTTALHRPAAFCVSDAAVVRTATVTPTVDLKTADPATDGTAARTTGTTGENRTAEPRTVIAGPTAAAGTAAGTETATGNGTAPPSAGLTG